MGGQAMFINSYLYNDAAMTFSIDKNNTVI